MKRFFIFLPALLALLLSQSVAASDPEPVFPVDGGIYYIASHANVGDGRLDRYIYDDGTSLKLQGYGSNDPVSRSGAKAQWRCTVTDDGKYVLQNVATGRYWGYKTTTETAYKLTIQSDRQLESTYYAIYADAARKYLIPKCDGSAFDHADDYNYNNATYSAYFLFTPLTDEEIAAANTCTVRILGAPDGATFALGGSSSMTFTSGACTSAVTCTNVPTGYTFVGFIHEGSAAVNPYVLDNPRGEVFLTPRFVYTDIFSDNYGDKWILVKNATDPSYYLSIENANSTAAGFYTLKPQLRDIGDAGQLWCFVGNATSFKIYNRRHGADKWLEVNGSITSDGVVPRMKDTGSYWTLQDTRLTTTPYYGYAIKPVGETTKGLNPASNVYGQIKLWNDDGDASQWQFEPAVLPSTFTVSFQAYDVDMTSATFTIGDQTGDQLTIAQGTEGNISRVTDPEGYQFRGFSYKEGLYSDFNANWLVGDCTLDVIYNDMNPYCSAYGEKWVRIESDQHAGYYLSVYQDGGVTRLKPIASNPNDKGQYWCMVGNATDGFILQNRAMGALYALKRDGGTDNGATMRMELLGDEPHKWQLINQANGSRGIAAKGTTQGLNPYGGDKGAQIKFYQIADAKGSHWHIYKVNLQTRSTTVTSGNIDGGLFNCDGYIGTGITIDDKSSGAPTTTVDGYTLAGFRPEGNTEDFITNLSEVNTSVSQEARLIFSNVFSTEYGQRWMRIKNGAIANNYIGLDGVRPKSQAKAEKERAQLWCLVGNATDGFLLYNNSLGDAKALKFDAASATAITNTGDANGRMQMVDAASGSTWILKSNYLHKASCHGYVITAQGINKDYGFNPHGGSYVETKFWDDRGEATHWLFEEVDMRPFTVTVTCSLPGATFALDGVEGTSWTIDAMHPGNLTCTNIPEGYTFAGFVRAGDPARTTMDVTGFGTADLTVEARFVYSDFYSSKFNQKWVRIKNANKGTYIGLAQDNDGVTRAKGANYSKSDLSQLWCLVGNATDGFQLYNAKTGADYKFQRDDEAIANDGKMRMTNSLTEGRYTWGVVDYTANATGYGYAIIPFGSTANKGLNPSGGGTGVIQFWDSQYDPGSHWQFEPEELFNTLDLTKAHYLHCARGYMYSDGDKAVASGASATPDDTYKYAFINKDGKYYLCDASTLQYVKKSSTMTTLSATCDECITLVPTGNETYPWHIILNKPKPAEAHKINHNDAGLIKTDWDDEVDDGNCWQIVEAGDLSPIPALTAAQNYMTPRIEGTGLGQYSQSTGENRETLLADAATLMGSETPAAWTASTLAPYTSFMARYCTYKRALTLNIPADGTLLRLRGAATANSSKYLSCSTGGSITLPTSTPDAGTIFCYTGGTLVSYNSGLHLADNTTTAYDAEAKTVTLLDAGTPGAYRVMVQTTQERYQYNGSDVINSGYGSSTTYNDAGYHWILEPVTSLPITVSAVGWGTMYSPCDLELPAGLRAYTTSSDEEGIIRLTPSDNIPGRAAVILRGTGGDYNLTVGDVVAPADAPEGQAMTGALAKMGAPSGSYVLSVGTIGGETGQVGLFPVRDSEILSQFKAYLPAPAASIRAYRFVFDDNATDVTGVLTDTPCDQQPAYDLTGRRITTPSRPGLYIIGGKKVAKK